MKLKAGDQVEIRVASGGCKVVEVIDNVDTQPGFLYEEVYGSERGRAFTDDVSRKLGV